MRDFASDTRLVTLLSTEKSLAKLATVITVEKTVVPAPLAFLIPVIAGIRSEFICTHGVIPAL